ncbi:ABC transporter permease [Bdellovibrionota bacterium FG-1]
MPFSEILKLAYEALISNKLRAGLTMLGMIIGVGAVVLLVSIGNGAKNYITHEFEGMGSNLIIVNPGKTDKKSGFGPPNSSVKRKLTIRDVEALERFSFNLDGVTGIVFGTGSVKTGEQTTNVSIMGARDSLTHIFNVKIGQGVFYSREEEEAGRRVAVLGYNVAHNLFGDESALGKLVKINESEHRVIGVTQKTGETLGFNMDDVVLIPTRDAMRVFNDDKLFGIRAKAKARVSVDDAVMEVKEILKQRHNGEEDFTVLTQVSMLQTMNTILGMLTFALGGIAMISMVVGGIGIMNIMLVSVTERTREIGIRRAVGARRKDVLRQFIAEALVLSLLGGLIGLLSSAAITYIIYFAVPKFDMRAPFWILIPAFAMSSVVGIIFGVWPAHKASQIETIDALRFE